MRAARRLPSSRRRRGHERGFSLVEMVVALTIAAMTLALISGASFSLRAIGQRAAADNGAAELLAVRRILHRWVSEAMLRGPGGAAAFVGDRSEVRFLLAPDTLAGEPARLAVLRIERDGDMRVLRAYRERDALSVLQDADGRLGDSSTLHRTAADLAFVFLVDDPRGTGSAWALAREPGPPPRALALDLGDGRRVVAHVMQDVDGGCLAAVGLGELQRDACRAR